MIFHRSVKPLHRRIVFGLPFVCLASWVNPNLLIPAVPGAHALPIAESASVVGVRSRMLQNFFVPPNSNSPNRTQGAAARGSFCPGANEEGYQSPTALLPESNYGQTVQDRPVFLVHVPNVPANTRNLFFHIRDEQGQSVFGTFLPIEQTTDIVRIKLPDEAPLMEPDTLYKWSVAIPCSGDLRPDTPFVSGWIERITASPGLPTQTSSSSLQSLEDVYHYGQAGVWYDMMALLDELKRSHPTDLETNTMWHNAFQLTGIDSSSMADGE